jgi:hypothetical protein
MEQFSEYQNEKGYDLNSITGDKEVVQEAARAITREEDITLLNELFDTTDELEATKNEGVILDGAIYAYETPEPETYEPETSEPEAYEPETSVPETYEPESTEPETSTGGQKSPSVGIIIPIAAIVLVIVAAVIGFTIYRRKRKA